MLSGGVRFLRRKGRPVATGVMGAVAVAGSNQWRRARLQPLAETVALVRVVASAPVRHGLWSGLLQGEPLQTVKGACGHPAASCTLSSTKESELQLQTVKGACGHPAALCTLSTRRAGERMISCSLDEQTEWTLWRDSRAGDTQEKPDVCRSFLRCCEIIQINGGGRMAGHCSGPSRRRSRAA